LLKRKNKNKATKKKGIISYIFGEWNSVKLTVTNERGTV